MSKKLISLMLACASLFVMFAFAGCGNDNYPVMVAPNTIIESEPKNIVVLDPAAADIIDYSGYIAKLVGRSEEVNQEQLSIAPIVGTAANPDIEAIASTGADLVFASDVLDAGVKKSLKDKGINVITMSAAQTQQEVETYYLTVGKILGGGVYGATHGEKAYKSLVDEMDKIKKSAESVSKSDVPYEVCYLYTENGELKMMTNGTYGDMLLSHTGAVNIAVNVVDNAVEVSTLKVANPDFVFYDSEDTLENIKGNEILSELSAVKNKKTLKITSDEMGRQGSTAIETLNKMVEFMYPELAKDKPATADEAAKPEDKKTDEKAKDDSKADDKKAEETTAPEVKSVAEDYGIKIDEKSNLKYEDENDDVKAMQQRLFDLGYVDDKENITGYYGDVSKKAVEEFQKVNKLEESGEADNKTLVAMFNEDAAKKE